MDLDELKQLVSNGESETLEFKKSIAIKAHLANPEKGKVPYFLQSSMSQ